MKLHIAHGVIRGMNYLHRMKVVHGDLKIQNVLVGNDYTAEVNEVYPFVYRF